MNILIKFKRCIRFGVYDMQRTTPVKDMHTGEIWVSVTDAARQLGRAPAAITQAIKRHGTVAGRHLVYETKAVYCDCCRAKMSDAA
jgi:IS30 family transposase